MKKYLLYSVLFILVIVFIFIQCLKPAQGSADSAPTPGNSGVISVTDVADTSITISWTKASDDEDPQTSLKYLVVYSDTSADMDAVSTIEAKITAGDATADGIWSTDIASKTINSVIAFKYYSFNIIVKDTAGNKTLYTKAPLPRYEVSGIDSHYMGPSPEDDGIYYQYGDEFGKFRYMKTSMDRKINWDSSGSGKWQIMELSMGWIEYFHNDKTTDTPPETEWIEGASNPATTVTVTPLY